MSNLVENNSDTENSGTMYVSERDFFNKNIIYDNNPNAVLGFSLLRIVEEHNNVRSLTITNECAQCIEMAGCEIDPVDKEDVKFEDEVGFLTCLGFQDDHEENGATLGSHIANLANLNAIIFDNATTFFENEDWRQMFENASLSRSVYSLCFNKCKLKHNIYAETLAAIFDLRNVKSLTFTHCVINNTFMEAVEEVENRANEWRSMRFEQCMFEDGVVSRIMEFQDELHNMIDFTIHECRVISVNAVYMINIKVEWECNTDD